ncbi:MAG: hypothetical protein R3E32_27075 [Chitinophagales bacterium]
MSKSTFPLILFLLMLTFNTYAQTQNSINYHQHIAPILQLKCVPCHQTNQIGPMSLSNYKEVAAYGKMIAHVTQIGLMPPFLADEPTKPHTFKGDKRLSQEEINKIQSWMQQGFLEGEANQKKQPFPKPLSLSEPDAVISISEAFEQYGVYYDQYRVFALPTNFEEDKWVSAIEFVAGNPKIVRHATISVDTSNQVKVWDDWDPQYGYFSFGTPGFVPTESLWYSWNPSQSYSQFPANQAKFLPKNATLLLHIHYGPTGVPQKDSSAIRLKFSPKPTPQTIQTAPLIHPFNMTNDTFLIAANERTRYHAKFTVPFDIELFGLYPQAHYLGRKWEIFAVAPNNREAEVLLKIKDWDFHWKQFFEYQAPKILKKGTVIHALAEYDNTLENLANPNDPPRTMLWGKRMYEELFLVYFSFNPHTNPTMNTSKFYLLPTATNIIHSDFEVQIEAKKSIENLTFEIIDFEGNTVLQFFENKSFKKGKHKLQIDLKKLKYGNYYFHLQNEKVEENRIFAYFPKGFFE